MDDSLIIDELIDKIISTRSRYARSVYATELLRLYPQEPKLWGKFSDYWDVFFIVLIYLVFFTGLIGMLISAALMHYSISFASYIAPVFMILIPMSVIIKYMAEMLIRIYLKLFDCKNLDSNYFNEDIRSAYAINVLKTLEKLYAVKLDTISFSSADHVFRKLAVTKQITIAEFLATYDMVSQAGFYGVYDLLSYEDRCEIAHARTVKELVAKIACYKKATDLVR